VNADNPTEEITTEAELADIRAEGLGHANRHKQWVLGNNITVNSPWTPIGSGNDSSAFQGKFYGNGRTILLNGGFTNNYSLFGYIQDATIHNLKVEYTDINIVSRLNQYFLAAPIALFPTGNNSISGCSGSIKFTGLAIRNSFWEVNGQIYLNLTEYTITEYSRIITAYGLVVDNLTEAALRYALTSSMHQDGDVIFLSGVTPGTTRIQLTSRLPDITKSITIEGNGITITRASSMPINETSQFLYVNTTSADVSINRVHFTGARTTNSGGAIRILRGNLTLESCIFSDNNSNTDAGAISNRGMMNIRGCTFYNNNSNNSTYATITHSTLTLASATTTLSGNLFYKVQKNVSVVSNSTPNSVISSGYNVIDVEYRTGSGPYSGFNATTGDANFAPISGSTNVGFLNNTTHPFTNTNTSGANVFVPLATGTLRTHIPSTFAANMPAVDFYGNVRTYPSAPGAVSRQP
jgi:hypothetical protein